MVTPTNDTQPAEESHAKPPRVPLPLLVTPPFVGERLIQPSFALHAYPVIAESVIEIFPLLASKFKYPPTLLQAYLYAGSMVPLVVDACARATPIKREMRTDKPPIKTPAKLFFCLGIPCMVDRRSGGRRR